MTWLSHGALIDKSHQNHTAVSRAALHIHILCFDFFSTHLYFLLKMFHLPFLVERASLLPVVFEVEMILLSEVCTPPPVIFISRLQSATLLCFCIWTNKEGCFSSVVFHMALFRNEPAKGNRNHLFKYHHVNLFFFSLSLFFAVSPKMKLQHSWRRMTPLAHWIGRCLWASVSLTCQAWKVERKKAVLADTLNTCKL